ncbi:MAG: glycosyltransferase family 1 protein [Elusimicrobiota bacterium]
MKIGLDISAALAGPSGIRFYIEELLAGLSRIGQAHRFTLYAAFWSDPGRLEALRLPRGGNFRLLHRRVPQRLLLRAEESLGLSFQELWLRDLDVFHGLGNTVPPLRRLPSAVTLHHVGGGVDAPDAWSEFYFTTLTAASARRAKAVLAVSDFSRQEAIAAYGLDAAKVTTILEGGPGDEFQPPDAASAKAPVEGPFLLAVGAIVERKNFAALVRAFRLLLEEEPGLPHRLVIAGAKGHYAPALEALVTELRLGPRVVFFGPASRAQLVALYQNASAFVFPSLMEGFGFPLLEAMACGAPVVASNASALPQVAGDAAVLVDASDPKALADAIGRILKDSGLSGTLRAMGPARAAQFSWLKTAEQTLAVYEHLLKS